MTERETAKSELHDLRGEIVQLGETIRDVSGPDFHGRSKQLYLARMRFRLQACEARRNDLERFLAQISEDQRGNHGAG